MSRFCLSRAGTRSIIRISIFDDLAIEDKSENMSFLGDRWDYKIFIGGYPYIVDCLRMLTYLYFEKLFAFVKYCNVTIRTHLY